LIDELSAVKVIAVRKQEVEVVAFSPMSLPYGEASFNYLGSEAGTRKRVRANAYALAATLTAGSGK
jgi:hypothetical protein